MSFLGALAISMMLLQGGVDATGTAVARPTGEVHLDPNTGSYFQIFEFYGQPPHTWRHARRMVRGYLYQGREGQLASVKTLETHYFLILQFPSMREVPMWIGLHAACNETAEVAWLDGAMLSEQSFRAWGTGAQAAVSRTCREHKQSGDEYPIYYNPDEFGVRWMMGTPTQNLKYMMVEFPVPEEEKADKKDAAPEAEAPAPDTGPGF